ncbi:40S ribosomal protein S9 [Histoplasma capsulatum H143]|uniref:40S ribosomal protein S9 n=1 Tax=Ajellomyces capsulatus (strain H143) TaxID=544712 RepID=C6HHV4_AJECH|nr:40S ribosomal protein S9 [Histoplasma capsulatum H143]
MAWQGPSCVARALRSAQNSFRREAHLSRTTCLSATTTHLQSQRRSLSTSPEQQVEITAAPPIDTTKLKTSPQRILPASPAYFTGTPKFIDHVLKLEQIHSEAPRTAFLKHSDYKNAINEEVPAAKYRQLQKILSRLNQIQPDKVPQEVKDILKTFTRLGDPYQQKIVPKKLDEMGRARGVGRRKTSHATVCDEANPEESRLYLDGSSTSREKEAWSFESQKDARLGQTVKESLPYQAQVEDVSFHVCPILPNWYPPVSMYIFLNYNWNLYLPRLEIPTATDLQATGRTHKLFEHK